VESDALGANQGKAFPYLGATLNSHHSVERFPISDAWIISPNRIPWVIRNRMPSDGGEFGLNFSGEFGSESEKGGSESEARKARV
jgi:hypothetical protein